MELKNVESKTNNNEVSNIRIVVRHQSVITMEVINGTLTS